MPLLVQPPDSLVIYNVVETSTVLTVLSSPSPLSPLVYTVFYLYVSWPYFIADVFKS